nr:hypothetical protein [Tanacetum cinerariifolium]
QYLVEAGGLQDGDVIVLLVLPYFFGHGHAAAQQLHHLGIEVVDLLAQAGQGVHKLGLVGGFVAPHEVGNELLEHLGRDLLLGIAPGIVGVDVALNHSAV